MIALTGKHLITTKVSFCHDIYNDFGKAGAIRDRSKMPKLRAD